MIKIEELSGHAGIRHGFFGRDGGVSDGVFASLNCGYGSGDDRERVAENRMRALAGLGLPDAALVTAHQRHTADAIHVDAAWTHADAPVADAMASTTPGIALGVLAADCAPILLADADAGVIGAAHAGWRGALDGVTDQVVGLMTQLGARADRITAAIGPTIAQESYEVGPEFKNRFAEDDGANADFFIPSVKAGHWMFDLPGYLARRLEARLPGRVVSSGHDTYPEDSGFYSYRRAVHRGESQYGRAMSAIALVP
ncbi:MAG: peptidoglycan editing factor PgeF [Rhodospirillales bacterium]|jgi:hypothetical protein|nr:polyphenol oxidase [Rhodospirillaceae bacterium]MDP6430460.1 peptidoglycan editing factor PgeF [Rhodospirillales bacterium]MDP6646509.1 peptidoglycan editing factor PgeF [Rhodospirillales bacterium]|tara:strand:- start:279 stop:1046 length:768 start_codon:yes stop_codon:yes gene_type:complete